MSSMPALTLAAGVLLAQALLAVDSFVPVPPSVGRTARRFPVSSEPNKFFDSDTTLEQLAEDREARRALENLAEECNPRIKYFDPLHLADRRFWGKSNAATINFLRHAEMKHGRVAMMGFVGYVVQANGIHFPWAIEANGFPPSTLTPPEQWDVFDPLAKLQLFGLIGTLELWSEVGGTHYMRGGKPGRFPAFVDEEGKRLPGLPVNLWDPLGLTKSMDERTKAIKLAKEVNNGRLAMLGMFGFFVESKVPGALPILSWLGAVEPYEGEYMLPFGYWDAILFFTEHGAWATEHGEASVLDMTQW